MEESIRVLIYIHAFFGGIGLITGVASIVFKKGSVLHKRSGKLFSIGMLVSSLISIPISWMPHHENIFLFLIGMFTIYLVLGGNRALSFKKNRKADWKDFTLSGSMFLCSLITLAFGIVGVINSSSMSILFLFFGGFGLFMTIQDFRFYKNINRPKNAWLRAHIGKIVGALIASVTAFVIAGLGFVGVIAWTLPTVLGTVYIIYWIRKVKQPRPLRE